MGNWTYSGKSIAEQLLGNTWVGRLLYGKPETYKDGYGTERKDADFKESANGQLVQRMGETAKSTGRTVLDNMLDVPMDIYSGIESGINGDWAGVGLAAASVVLPQTVETGIKNIRKYNFDKQVINRFREYLRKIGANDSEFTDNQLMDLLSDRKEQFLSSGGEKLLSTPDKVELYKDNILAGDLSLGSKGIEGQMISGIERKVSHEVMPTDVSTPLYTAGVKQAQDNGFGGLESGHNLKRADKTLNYINLHNGNFEGRVVGKKLGKASTTDKEQAITAEWFKRYQEALNQGFNIDDAERYAYEFSERLSDGLPSYHFDNDGNPIVEGWEIPIDVIMLTKGNRGVNHVSLFPTVQSINHRKKNGTWDFSEFHQNGGTLKYQSGTKFLIPHKDYLGVPYKQDGDYNYFEAHPDNVPSNPNEHWTSRNPITGKLLKSEIHSTFDLMIKGEKEADMDIYRGLNGELYSYPKDKFVPLYLKYFNYGKR